MAGITHDDKALVVSQRGNPDGLIARTSLEEITDEQVTPDSSAPLQKAPVNAPRSAGQIPDRSVSQADRMEDRSGLVAPRSLSARTDR